MFTPSPAMLFRLLPPCPATPIAATFNLELASAANASLALGKINSDTPLTVEVRRNLRRVMFVFIAENHHVVLLSDSNSNLRVE